MDLPPLSRQERYQINAQIAFGTTLTAMAAQLGRHKSTLSRELKRNRIFLNYHADVAEHLAQARQKLSTANARPIREHSFGTC